MNTWTIHVYYSAVMYQMSFAPRYPSCLILFPSRQRAPPLQHCQLVGRFQFTWDCGLAPNHLLNFLCPFSSVTDLCKPEEMDGNSEAASERILLEPYKYLLQLPGESFLCVSQCQVVQKSCVKSIRTCSQKVIGSNILVMNPRGLLSTYKNA